ncbi:hypothetical protein RDV64_11995 [Acuticoccus sp. MNP-M23]|uniref:DUF6602 domain-containing protein n=1 Tax=Acuticoccus sp. MNP-M23 TaxID=3072793 RepID=UPI002816484D|nr:DUF6602 domain-containing protein [Acuticoccus sp. MNP-M23]WMS40822.1 hypothetical protein RDV64_11995 [Acuticoccus sp. MNP-M23]
MINLAAIAVAVARSLQKVNHSGLKGELWELMVRELLELLLPPGCAIGTGEIVSAYGGTSNQNSVVVADRGVHLPVLIRDAGTFPLEACVLTHRRDQEHSDRQRAPHVARRRRSAFRRAHARRYPRHDAASSRIDHRVIRTLHTVTMRASRRLHGADNIGEMRRYEIEAILGAETGARRTAT